MSTGVKQTNPQSMASNQPLSATSNQLAPSSISSSIGDHQLSTLSSAMITASAATSSNINNTSTHLPISIGNMLPPATASPTNNNIHLPPISVQLTPGAAPQPQQQTPTQHNLAHHPQTTPSLGSLPQGHHHMPHTGGFTPPQHPLPPFLPHSNNSSSGSVPPGSNLPAPPMYTGHTGPVTCQPSTSHPHHAQPPIDVPPASVPPPTESKPKKKRKPKKKKESQQQPMGGGPPQSASQNQGHMQLPLDLDLRPMRMPMLPQFPPDFTLGVCRNICV